MSSFFSKPRKNPRHSSIFPRLTALFNFLTLFWHCLRFTKCLDSSHDRPQISVQMINYSSMIHHSIHSVAVSGGNELGPIPLFAKKRHSADMEACLTEPPYIPIRVMSCQWWQMLLSDEKRKMIIKDENRKAIMQEGKNNLSSSV